jgi:hypothetical protein
MKEPTIKKMIKAAANTTGKIVNKSNPLYALAKTFTNGCPVIFATPVTEGIELEKV